MSTSNESTKCPQCGSALPVDAPSGLCPKCLMQQGMVKDTQPPVEKLVTLSPATDLTPESVPVVTESGGRYICLGEHGRGGMGRVLLVHDAHLERDIVMKELLPQAGDGSTPTPVRHSKEMASRFLREAKITGQLEHPSITPVHELGRREDGTLYYTMKFVRGRTLTQAIREARNLEERLRLLPHFVDLCNAIAYAHSRGVIHRDIKPSNVMVGEYGETMIIDWGLAKVKGTKEKLVKYDPAQETLLGVRDGRQSDPDSGKTQQGQALGTPAYMPPEQAAGDLDHIDERSDVYSLGAVLFELLTGVSPFDGISLQHILRQVMAGEVRSVTEFAPKTDPELVAIVKKAMALKPHDRYQSAKELADKVQSWKPKREKSRLRKIVQRTVLAILIIVPLTVVLLDTYYGWKVQAEIEKIRAQGGMLTPEDYRSPREEEALARQGEREARVFSPPGFLVTFQKTYPSLGESDTSTELDALAKAAENPVLMSAEEVSQIESVLREYAGPLEQIEYIAEQAPASGQEIINMTEIKSRGSIKALLPNLLPVRCATFLMQLKAALLWRDGQYDAALDELVHGVDWALHVEDYPFLISNMIAVYSKSNTLRDLDQWFTTGLPTEDKLHAFLATLERAKRHTEVAPGFNGERYFFVWAFKMLDRGTPAALIYGDQGENRDPGQAVFFRLYSTLPFRFWRRHDQWVGLTMHNRFCALSGRPWQEVQAELAKEQEEIVPVTSPLSSIAIPNVYRTFVELAKSDALLDVTQVGCALKLYQMRHGAYPDSLDALVPEILAEVSVDVFSGEPLHYLRKESGFLLYSVGENMQDDGGIDLMTDGTPADIVWQMAQ